MKIIFLGFAFFFSLLLSCSKPLEIKDDNVSIEGKVEYYSEKSYAIGGETDPSGFILSDYQWKTKEPGFDYYRIYVANDIDSSYLNKRVHIIGKLEILEAGGVETRKREFPEIKINQIEIIN